MTDDNYFDTFFLSAIIGAGLCALFIMLMLAGGVFNYHGVQTIHVIDKYPSDGGYFAIVTCDQVYYVSDPLMISKIVKNGTYKVKFANNPMVHINLITDIISGDTTQTGCS